MAVVELTGIAGAHMSYSVDMYARLVVIRYGYKLVGWPHTVPFRNFSNMGKGAVARLLVLQDLWKRGELKFETADREDLSKAARDPKLVHPNPKMRGPDCEQDATAESVEPARTIVSALVLHPADLTVLGVH
ncbi:hypothetical protein BV20DRAFT_907783, partial [Pilatotrama ljubarskyi]